MNCEQKIKKIVEDEGYLVRGIVSPKGYLRRSIQVLPRWQVDLKIEDRIETHSFCDHSIYDCWETMTEFIKSASKNGFFLDHNSKTIGSN